MSKISKLLDSIDKTDAVKFINYSMPRSTEDYVSRRMLNECRKNVVRCNVAGKPMFCCASDSDSDSDSYADKYYC